jgi:hypothetical protein
VIEPPEGAWQALREVEGIAVARAGLDTDRPWGRARGLLEASPEAALAAILDFPAKTRFVPRLREAQVLYSGNDEAVVRFLLALPWPLADRDWIARYAWRRLDGGVVEVDIDPDSRFTAPRGRARPLGEPRGRWRLAPRGVEQTVAEFVYSTHFAGWLPRRIVDETAWRYPLETLRGLRRELVERGQRAMRGGR